MLSSYLPYSYCASYHIISPICSSFALTSHTYLPYPIPSASLFGMGSVGFNPMWEETLVFMVHMPELALVRFLVWDHDPIGQDFIGQRTIAFNSMMPGKTWCCFWMALTLVQGFLLCFSDYILKQGTQTGNSLYKFTIHLLYITNLVLLIPSLC